METSKKVRQREIKFRCWDKNEKQMVSPDYITRDGCGFWQANSIPTMSKILMQWTGLRDKNGKEIYEGDIFRVEESHDEQDRIYYLVIVWVQEWCMFTTLLVDDEYARYLASGIEALDEPLFWTYTLEDTNDKRFFLCGNIYETPHLLSQGEIKTELI